MCRKVKKLAKLEIEKKLKELSDWRLDYIQKRKFGREISPFLVRKLFEKSKCKKSTFTQRKTRIIPNYPGNEDSLNDLQMNEVC